MWTFLEIGEITIKISPWVSLFLGAVIYAVIHGLTNIKLRR